MQLYSAVSSCPMSGIPRCPAASGSHNVELNAPQATPNQDNVQVRALTPPQKSKQDSCCRSGCEASNMCMQVLVRLRQAQGAERDIGNVVRLNEHVVRLRKENQVPCSCCVLPLYVIASLKHHGEVGR